MGLRDVRIIAANLLLKHQSDAELSWNGIFVWNVFSFCTLFYYGVLVLTAPGSVRSSPLLSLLASRERDTLPSRELYRRERREIDSRALITLAPRGLVSK